MERHGFARQLEFNLLDSTISEALFSLVYSNITLAHYPYKFELIIKYTLEGKKLTITYQVHNKDDAKIYFSVGAHPAFNVPFFTSEVYADYFIEFNRDEKLERHLLSENGFFNGKTQPIPLENGKLHLTKDLFNKDALVFKNISSRQVKLGSHNHQHSLTVTYEPFNYLGLWAKPGAPFVCIEPWLGCADTEGKPLPIQEKEAIQELNAGKVFEAAFSISVS
jgi:galactose mutarotase-like enzyme